MKRWTTTIALAACGLLAPMEAFCDTTDVLRAEDVFTPTNIDWMALATAQRTVMSGGFVEFRWSSLARTDYAKIRRTLWLAALYGLTDQTSSDADTRRIMAPELDAAKRRLKTPFAEAETVRPTTAARQLLTALTEVQSPAFLAHATGPCDAPTVLACNGSEVTSEKSSVTFTSIRMAATFTQSSHTDDGLVFEENGHLARDIFIRRFRDRTATVVNLLSKPRSGLVYKSRFTAIAFDLPSEGVIHLTNAQTFRLSRDCGDRFYTELWRVTFEGDVKSRLVDSEILTSVVDESYRGRISFKTTVLIPPGGEMLILHLDDPEAETEVWLGGQRLGTRAWEPFEWNVPLSCNGRSLPLEIRLWKRSLKAMLQAPPTWRRR